MTLVIIDNQLTQVIVRCIVASTVAMIAHEIVAHQWRNLLDETLLINHRNVVAHEPVEGVYIVEGILRVMLI